MEMLDAGEVVIGDGSYVFTLEKRGYVQAGKYTKTQICKYTNSIISATRYSTCSGLDSISSSHSKISAICWYHFFVLIFIPLDGAVIDGDMLSIVLSTFLII